MPKILIVEDDPTLLKVLKAKLEKEGYDVVTAKDGDTVMKLMQEKPDGVLLDMLLPKKSGMEILEELQRYPELSAIPIIIVSNSGQPVEIERAKSLGVKDYLVKTDFTPQEVIDKLAPYVPPPKGRKRGGANNATPAGSRGSLLVVEDDAFLRKLLVEKLKREGFEVQEASGGKEALEFLKKRTPTLVLLDLVMPGVDGFQVLQEMRQDPKTKDIPVIVLSNLGEPEHIERAKSLGADEYLVKAHFILDEIIEKIAKVISRRYL